MSCDIILMTVVHQKSLRVPYSFLLHKLQLAFLFTLVETDTDAGSSCTARSSRAMDVRLHVLHKLHTLMLFNMNKSLQDLSYQQRLQLTYAKKH